MTELVDQWLHNGALHAAGFKVDIEPLEEPEHFAELRDRYWRAETREYLQHIGFDDPTDAFVDRMIVAAQEAAQVEIDAEKAATHQEDS